MGENKLTLEKRESLPPVWDMSQERALNDQLLGNRLNFFLLVFTVVIAGALNAKVQVHLVIVLGIGSVICTLLARIIARTHKKLCITLEHLYQDDQHPFTIVDKESNGDDCQSPEKSWINDGGIWLPRFCCVVLYVGFVVTSVDLICSLNLQRLLSC